MLKFVRERLRQIKAKQRFREIERSWHHLQQQLRPMPLAVGRPERLVVMPSDPWTLVGAKGDEAMIQSVVTQIQAASPTLEVGVLTASPMASEAARALGYQALEVWDGGVSVMAEAVHEFGADVMAVLGADCMDGYYNPMTTLTMLAVSDLAARDGVRVSILGFSFNDRPDERLRSVFECVSERVLINVRDEISFNRFRSFCRAKVQLVADSAFQLRPVVDSQVVLSLKRWVERQHQVGRTVLGLNVHPMLLGEPGPLQIQQLIDQVAQEVCRYLDQGETCIALISHDYRDAIGDDVCLRPLYRVLSKRFGERIYYDETRCKAAELKGLAGALDGVVTGRMHLAIAALGMGVPVAALTYQDKFQGLMKHFELPQSLLLAPARLRQSGALFELLAGFEANLPDLLVKTNSALPQVSVASMRNVSVLLGEA